LVKINYTFGDFLNIKRKALLFTILAGFLWGTSFPAIKIGLEFVDAYMFAFLRFSLASIIMFLFLLLTKNLDINIAKKRCLWYLGILNGIAYLLQFVGMAYTTASKSSLFVNLSAIWVAMLSWLILKEKFDNKKLLGIVFAILGVFFITTNLDFSSLTQGMIYGDTLVLIAGFGWSFFIIYNKKIVSNAKNTFQLMAWVLIITTLPLIPFVAFSSNVSLNLPVEAWLVILYTSFSWITPYYLWVGGLKHMSPVTSTIVLLIEIIVAIVISFLILKEGFTLIAGVGALLILLAIFLVSFKEQKSI